MARSKISFSLEIFNLARNLEFLVWSLGPLGIPRTPNNLFAVVRGPLQQQETSFEFPQKKLAIPEEDEKQYSLPISDQHPHPQKCAKFDDDPQRKFLWVRRGCQASQRKRATSGEVPELPGKFGELPGKFGKLPGNLWIAVKFHSERTSGEVAENFRGSSGNFRGSPRTSQKLGGAWLPTSDSPNLSPAIFLSVCLF